MIHEITERCEWTAILRYVDSHDFYHTFDYHKLCESSGDRSVLLVYRESSALIAVPLVIRAIPGTDLRDATSVYGYPGPLSSGIPTGFDSSRFRSELTGYFHDRCIVSVFSRLNPYIKGQRHILDGIGDLNIAGQVVGIDLGMSALQQRERFSRSLKTQLNRARRETLVREGTGREDIAKFCDIYRESM